MLERGFQVSPWIVVFSQVVSNVASQQENLSCDPFNPFRACMFSL